MQTDIPPGYILIDPKSLLLSILIIVLIILAILAMVAVYNLIKTLKQSQKVLDDFEVVASIASERTKQLDKIINDVSNKIKAGQNAFNSIPIIISAVSKIANVISKQNEQKASNAK